MNLAEFLLLCDADACFVGVLSMLIRFWRYKGRGNS
jgi:hypothetical protein